MADSGLGYQVRQIGKSSGNAWSATKETVCVEWSESPEGKEVVVRNLTGEEWVMPREEVRQVVNDYRKLLASLRQ